jgi:hypothetical protein
LPRSRVPAHMIESSTIILLTDCLRCLGCEASRAVPHARFRAGGAALQSASDDA